LTRRQQQLSLNIVLVLDKRGFRNLAVGRAHVTGCQVLRNGIIGIWLFAAGPPSENAWSALLAFYPAALRRNVSRSLARFGSAGGDSPDEGMVAGEAGNEEMIDCSLAFFPAGPEQIWSIISSSRRTNSLGSSADDPKQLWPFRSAGNHQQPFSTASK
jgi:hypothetical protein